MSHARDYNTVAIEQHRYDVLVAQIGSLENKISTLTNGVELALAKIEQMQKHEPHKTTASHTTTTIEERKKALDRPSPAPTTHSFYVTHYEADIKYSPDDFHMREQKTRTPPTSPPTSQACARAGTPLPLAPPSRTSTPINATGRVPQEIVRLLDEAMVELDGLEPGYIGNYVEDSLETIYEYTEHFDFWDNRESDKELDLLIRARYPQHLHFFMKPCRE